MLCFLETPVLRSALLAFYRWVTVLYLAHYEFLLQNATVLTKCDVYEKMDLCIGKLRSLWQVYFVLPILLCLNIDFWHSSIVLKCCAVNSRLSNEKLYSNFSRRALVFQKTCLKSKVCVMLKISYDYYLKTCQSIKQRTILKTPTTTF